MPRDTLTKEQIVETAIELLDEEGLDGLNMRNLGKRLGSAATAVYWHVQSKDNLILLVGDRVWDEIALPDVDAVGWRAAATELATGLHDMLSRHPWLVQAFGSHLFYGVSKARYDECSLAVYEKGGFTGAHADRAAGAVFTFVLGCVLGVAAQASLTRRLARDGGDAAAAFQETLDKAAEIAKQFPRLRSRVEAPTPTDYATAPVQTFEFGLEALLNGLESQRPT
ncbi:TetR/AcrR family transcriptional regulator [Nonomuraea ceibae]|uniref:TetR/AcrR family transcriptional regulator n=1 Tax=Nonomuraea ceibae TaxID=1935170 RepID=UPI001C5E32B7|nr:TetR/AcrR family transcriptional regulator [Nonomuraea ceibae]